MAKGKRQSSKKKKGKKTGNKKPPKDTASTDDDDHQDASTLNAADLSVNQTSVLETNASRMIRRDPNHPLSPLERLAPHLLFKIVNHLEQRDKDILFHVVTGQEIPPEGEQEEEQATSSEHGSHSHANATATASNRPGGRWRIPMEFVTSDPDTLLARLNTRRLYKRLKDKTDYTYPSNMTTDEIALLEWNNILKRATSSSEVAPVISPSRELLMFTPCPRSVAVLASYPRSGNSLLRSLYEKITLRVSGSDMRGGLVSHDLVGEAAVSSNRVQFVKTHYPERRGIKPYPASRVVLLVRNPYDALESYFNLMTTGTHTSTLGEEMRNKLTSTWQSMVQKEICVWQAFNEFWLSQNIPLLLVRYEDLIRYPYQVMCRVIQFVLEINNMDFFASRIAQCVAEEQIEQLGSYQPRSGGIGKSLSRYTPEMLQSINFGIFDTMEQLDYTSMLIPNKEEWELEPLPDYSREYYHDPNNTVIVNDESKPLVRTPKHRTNWAKLKREINGMPTGTCHCAKCVGRGR